MAEVVLPEVIISGCGKSKNNFSMTDLHTGACLLSAKRQKSDTRNLCLVGKDYAISSLPENPVMYVWPIAQINKVKKMVVPGIVSAMAVSRQGTHLVAAIDRKLHIWQLFTGSLLRVLTGHMQGVNCIKFTSDGMQFISGGAEGFTLVWLLSSILANEEFETMNNIKPRFLWKDHSLAVTDIHVGYFGSKSRVATVSRDCTCKLYDLSNGSLILSVFMDSELLAVSMDSAERFIFLGSNTGDIYSVNLPYCDSNNIHYDVTDVKRFGKFKDHVDEITCLSVSMDGQTLMSGSNDQCLKLWEIQSQACIRTIQCDGQVTNAFLAMTPPAIKNVHDKKYLAPAFEFATLKRQLHGEQEKDNQDVMFKNSVPLTLKNHQLTTWDLSCGMDLLDGVQSSKTSDDSKAHLKNKVVSSRAANKQMYHYLVDNFMSTLNN